jgi:uncharacterized integral membrane protein
MQVVRTLVWVLVTAVLVAFVAMNWTKAPVNLWPLDQGYLYVNWPVGLIALVFFALGLVPAWLLHRITRWRLKRRIGQLESTVSLVSTASPVSAAAPVDPA